MTPAAAPPWDDDPVPLDIVVGGGEGTPEVRVAGELDLHGSDALVARVRALARPGGSLRVDLAGITFIDSTGANALLRIDRDARHAGAAEVRFVVVRGGPVARLLELTGLVDTLDLETRSRGDAGTA